MDGQYITRHERDVGGAILIQHGFTDGNGFALAYNVGPFTHLVACEVRILEQGTPLEPAGDTNELPGCHPLRKCVRTWLQDLSANSYTWRVRFVPASDQYGIERLQSRCGGARQYLAHAELNCFRMEIWGNQADDFADGRGLGKQVGGRANHVSEGHLFAKGYSAGPGEVTSGIDDPLAVGKNRSHNDAVAITYCEAFH